MSSIAELGPPCPVFDAFLYANVGVDQNGTAVTVLSALARMGFNPWAESADLAALGAERAGIKLGAMLGAFRDLPAVMTDPDPVARRLALLLPKDLTNPLSLKAPKGQGLRASYIFFFFMFVFLVMVLAQAYLPATVH